MKPRPSGFMESNLYRFSYNNIYLPATISMCRITTLIPQTHLQTGYVHSKLRYTEIYTSSAQGADDRPKAPALQMVWNKISELLLAT